MELPTPPQAVAALAAFLRHRLEDVSDSLAPLWNRRDDAARQLAVVIVGAAAPFAPTSYSRARLIRQMHASGPLTDEHVRRVQHVLELEAGDDAGLTGAPR